MLLFPSASNPNVMPPPEEPGLKAILRMVAPRSQRLK
jgi:hypothetical protein